MATHSYADWKAPAEDGKSLIWPAPAELLAQTRENSRRLSAVDSPIQNIPLNEVRRAAREFIGHREAKAPLIATGHQTELHHAGVWVKNALIDAVATKMNGAAYHVAVDTDEPKHLALRWPGAGAESSVSIPISDDPAITAAAWSGLVAGPTPGHLDDLQTQLGAAEKPWTFHPLADEFLAQLKSLSIEPAPLPKMLTAALHQLDWSLSLRHHALLASPIWNSPAFLLFTHHVLARAGDFAASYNGALADYCRENGIKTPGRPMPDLKINGEEIEAPFWLDNLAEGSRIRCAVRNIGGQFVINHGGDGFTFTAELDGWDAAQRLAEFLRRHRLRVAPRALMLTLFIRLFLADQFVHGIGGGRYDQVTDRLIEDQFGIGAPRFSVTTATLYFPGAHGRKRACLPCVAQEGHRLRHALLGDRKREMVDAIAGLPRHSMQRREVFARMHTELANALAAEPQSLRDWESRFNQAQAANREDAVMFDRELFYGMQTRPRLEDMIGRYRDTMGKKS